MVSISIHASTREATPNHSQKTSLSQNFNSRLYTRGDCDYHTDNFRTDTISIHASTREATDRKQIIKVEEEISIHASTREATLWIVQKHPSSSISIHASTREATITCRGPYVVGGNISIHASTREATKANRLQTRAVWDFNSRLYTRGDQSCHATECVRIYFNSRLCMRGNKTVAYVLKKLL